MLFHTTSNAILADLSRPELTVESLNVMKWLVGLPEAVEAGETPFLQPFEENMTILYEFLNYYFLCDFRFAC